MAHEEVVLVHVQGDWKRKDSHAHSYHSLILLLYGYDDILWKTKRRAKN